MIESPRNLPTPQERLETTQLISQIFKTEQSRDLFLLKMANNKKLSASLADGGRPQLHQFLSSLNTFKRVRGYLTDKQKIALEREVRKYASYLLTLRVARPAVNTISQPVDEPPHMRDDAPLEDDEALIDEREGMQEA